MAKLRKPEPNGTGTQLAKTCSTERNTTSVALTILQGIFACSGKAMTLTSDNGYQFISEQFKRFFTGKRHRSTHSSTGMQKGLWTDTLEEIREKITAVLEDPSEAINTSPFCFRSTSNRSAPGEKSPAELLLCRSLWTSSDLLKSPTSFLKQMEQSKQGNQYNGRHAAKIISYNPQNLVHGPRSYKNCTVGRVGNSIYAAENELLYNPTD